MYFFFPVKATGSHDTVALMLVKAGFERPTVVFSLAWNNNEMNESTLNFWCVQEESYSKNETSLNYHSRVVSWPKAGIIFLFAKGNTFGGIYY